MFSEEEISEILSIVRFNYRHEDKKTNDFIQTIASDWFEFQDKKFQDMMRLTANAMILKYGLDKME